MDISLGGGGIAYGYASCATLARQPGGALMAIINADSLTLLCIGELGHFILSSPRACCCSLRPRQFA